MFHYILQEIDTSSANYFLIQSSHQFYKCIFFSYCNCIFLKGLRELVKNLIYKPSLNATLNVSKSQILI